MRTKVWIRGPRQVSFANSGFNIPYAYIHLDERRFAIHFPRVLTHMQIPHMRSIQLYYYPFFRWFCFLIKHGCVFLRLSLLGIFLSIWFLPYVFPRCPAARNIPPRLLLLHSNSQVCHVPVGQSVFSSGGVHLPPPYSSTCIVFLLRGVVEGSLPCATNENM